MPPNIQLQATLGNFAAPRGKLDGGAPESDRYVVNDKFKPIMVINMKYVIGSLIISFGILFVVVVVLMSLNVQAPEGVMKYLGWAWALLAIITYPLAKKLIRN